MTPVLTVKEICDQYAWLYTDLPVPVGQWDHLIPTDGAYCAIKFVGNDLAYVMDRGSTTPMDWYDDFRFDAIPFYDPKLGSVHNGFRQGVLSNVGYIESLVGDRRVIYVGHSLGAGRARIRAGYRLADGKKVECVVTFGAPRAGGPKLTSILNKGTPEYSYRNCDPYGHDLVTGVPIQFMVDVPFIGPQGIQYEQPCSLLDVHAKPRADDPWLAFKYHHFRLYCNAFGAIGQAALSLKA